MDPEAHDSLKLDEPGLVSQNGREGGYHWESYRRDLRRFVSQQLGRSHEVDDVVQTIYQSVLESPTRDAIQNPRAWLWRIAWRVLNLARQRQMIHLSRSVAVDPGQIKALAEQNRMIADSPEAQLEAADELLAALEALPPETQIAIVRSRRDGWSNEKIGQALGVSPHMAKKHIIRALKHFAMHAGQARARTTRKDADR